MISLLQRVNKARVDVDGQTVAKIGRGLLVFAAIHRNDDDTSVRRMTERILTYRVFPDDAGRMNRSVSDLGAGLLLVPQFTLTADTKKGTRASFTKGAPPDVARDRFSQLAALCEVQLETVQTGRFGADMQVHLVNDGPVTFWLEA